MLSQLDMDLYHALYGGWNTIKKLLSVYLARTRAHIGTPYKWSSDFFYYMTTIESLFTKQGIPLDVDLVQRKILLNLAIRALAK